MPGRKRQTVVVTKGIKGFTMKHSFLSFVIYGCMAAGLAGCARSTAVMQPDSDAAQRKPGPRAKKDKILLVKGKPKKDAAVVREKSSDSKSQPEGRGFHLPPDRGGKLLGTLLPPHRHAPPAPSGFGSGPSRTPTPTFVSTPDLPLPPSQATLPGPRLGPPAKALHPRALPDDTSLTGNWPSPRLPQRSDLPDSARVRMPSPRVDRPLDLPLLSQALPDRASLTDPTLPMSTKAAMRGKIPPRTTPAPFVRENLPDPFEHRQVIRLRKQPKEDQVPLEQGSSKPAK
jgi:hypothetical protein